jgi:hypothetical protein
VVPKLLFRCESHVLDRGAQANDQVAAQVFDSGAQADAHGTTRCASQVLNFGA